MSIVELRELDYEAQKLFAKEYLPLVYERLEDDGVEIVKEDGDISPIMPSFNNDDEMFFTRNGRRVDQ
jgi:spermidine synthase